MDPARRTHYGDFYDGPIGDGPVAFVHGNCQAESLRVLLATSPTFPHPLVRLPPVHELTAADLVPLRALLRRTAILLAQPIRDDYRELPIGTRQLAAQLPPDARLLRFPVIRHSGLHPWSAIVRHPSDRSVTPPVVPYHDLRTLAAAAGRPRPRRAGAAALRAAAADSVAELARRERRTADVGVSDLLMRYGVDAAHTLNHPGNPVLVALARRVQRALGTPQDAGDPGRPLLGGIRAPLEEPVLDALGIAAEPRAHWLVDGAPVSAEHVAAEQARWYVTHPQWVEAGLARHAGRMERLGL